MWSRPQDYPPGESGDKLYFVRHAFLYIFQSLCFGTMLLPPMCEPLMHAIVVATLSKNTRLETMWSNWECVLASAQSYWFPTKSGLEIYLESSTSHDYSSYEIAGCMQESHIPFHHGD